MPSAGDHSPPLPSQGPDTRRAPRMRTVREWTCRDEIARVLGSLADQGIVPVLIKGAPLAYTVYDDPSLRPRGDTDLLVRPEEVQQARRILKLGVEKVVFNAAAWSDPTMLSEASREFGAQAVVASIDVRRKLFGRYEVCVANGSRPVGVDPVFGGVGPDPAHGALDIVELGRPGIGKCLRVEEP